MTSDSPRKSRFVVKMANGEDDTVARILRDLHTRTFGDSAPQIEPEYGHWWIAWLKDRAAGFCGLKISQSSPGDGYLHRAGVLAQHRGNGLQRRFIRVREALARELGMSRMVTDTTDNVASANSLMSCGYRLYTPEGPWAFSSSLYWQKPLKD